MLTIAKALEYTLPNYPIEVTSTDGLSDLTFSDFETLADYICSKGGLFTVWPRTKNLTINLCFIPSQQQLSADGVTYSLSRQDRMDEQMASDLEKLFGLLCQELKPLYGYSSDEWLLEAAFPGTAVLDTWTAFEKSIVDERPPSLLFWLNYFDARYLTSIGERPFETVPYRKVSAGEQGAFIYLSDQPWEARLAKLENDGKYYLAARL